MWQVNPMPDTILSFGRVRWNHGSFAPMLAATRRSESDGRQRIGRRGHTATSVGSRIDIVSDAICPWCYIGKRQLERALALLAPEGLHFSVHWNPFQLNPDMPKEGRDRIAYRAVKFGSAERARELDERVATAAAGVGPAASART